MLLSLVSLASHTSVSDQRLNQFVAVFSRVINYFNNPEFAAIFSDPVKFHSTFNSKYSLSFSLLS